METVVKPPLYIKLSLITVGFLAFFYILLVGKQIIVPLIFATIISILLNPVVNFLCKKGFNRVVAILLAVITAVILLASATYFIVSQASLFSDALPQFKEKFITLFNECEKWISGNFNIAKPKIDAWIIKTKAERMDNSTQFIGQAISSFGNALILLVLLPVYIFFILYYKPLLLEFIAQLFKNDQQKTVQEVLTETKTLIQSYLIGLLIEMAIVATLNSIGLLILGVQYAIFIGIIGALLNVIPYIGGVIAISLPMLIALATQQPIVALWVFILYGGIQFIDNHIIIPKIVAGKVKINALVSIIVVLFGNALWGVAGMFIAIPLTAIIKVIFDRITPLKPFGFLIGDNQPEIGIINFRANKEKRSKTKD